LFVSSAGRKWRNILNCVGRRLGRRWGEEGGSTEVVFFQERAAHRYDKIQ